MSALRPFVLCTALLSGLWVVGLTLIGGAFYPSYDHARQFISELGATGAPHAAAVNWGGFLPAGLLSMSFAALAWLLAPRALATTLALIGLSLFGLGYFTSAFFQCDAGCAATAEPSLSQRLHFLFGSLGYLFAPLALLTLAWQARRWPQAGALAWFFAACGAVALVSLPLVSHEFEYHGAAQRGLEAATLSAIAALGLYLRRDRAIG